MNQTVADLPWYVELLDQSVDGPGLARLVADYQLVAEPWAGSSRWFENMTRGFSVHAEAGQIDCIAHLSELVDGARRFSGPLPMHLDFGQSRRDVVLGLGTPTHEATAGIERPSILRYDVGRCWVAITFAGGSSEAGCIRSVLLESRDCAAKFVGSR